jgi:hypothetical protein
VLARRQDNNRRSKIFEMRLLFLRWRRALVLIASIGIFFSSTTSALAAERVVLKYRVFRQSLSVKELTNFAETGELSRPLRVNFAMARQDPKQVRQYLTEPVKVDPVLLDRVLNSQVGNLVLDEISQVIHTPSRQADRQALRAALILSASRDRQITLIETLQNYPTSTVEVDGERLESAYLQLRRLGGPLEKILGTP